MGVSDFRVEGFERVEVGFGGDALAGVAGGGLEGVVGGGAGGGEVFEGACERVDIAWGIDDGAGAVRHDGFAKAQVQGADDGQAGGEGFHGDEADGFVEGGENESVGGGVEGGHFVGGADKEDAGLGGGKLKLELRAGGGGRGRLRFGKFDVFANAALANDEQPPPCGFGDGLDGVAEALAAEVVTDEEGNGIVGVQAIVAAEPGAGVGGCFGR